jgi:hypothetical protein
MPACDAYIREGALPPSPRGRLAPPGLGAHVIGDAGRRCRGQRAAGRCRERARVLAESAQGLTSA